MSYKIQIVSRIKFFLVFDIFVLLFAYPVYSQEKTDSVVISEIIILGNYKTKENVILRELTFKTGDRILLKNLPKLIEDSKLNLLKMPLFNFVNTEIQYSDSQHIVIVLTVTERWYFWPQAAIYYADRNFTNWLNNKDWSRTDFGLGLIKYNFRGRNEKLSFYSIFGYDEEFILNYEHIYFDKKRQHSGALFLKQLKRKETGCMIENDRVKFIKLSGQYALKAYNATFKYQFRKKIYISNSLYLGFEHRTTADSLFLCNPHYTINPNAPVNYFFLKYIFLNDKRDSRIFPLKGYRIKLKAVKNGLYIFPESEINSLKLKGEFSKYSQLNSKFYLENNLTLQKTFGQKNPFFLNTALGYSSNIRAYEYYVVNGGDFILLKNTLNYELLPKKIIRLNFIPWKKFNTLFIKIYADIFTDAAYVKNDDVLYIENNTLANTLLYSCGAGINIVTYYDWLIRLEYSVNRQKNAGFFLHFEVPF
ncbi:MAG: BamA/TamA family outer membrane protein [Chlorobi bacterium]|nr:BamA/TamA family outer membrane protein [Chlorobiota bacterium]